MKAVLFKGLRDVSVSNVADPTTDCENVDARDYSWNEIVLKPAA